MFPNLVYWPEKWIKSAETVSSEIFYSPKRFRRHESESTSGSFQLNDKILGKTYICNWRSFNTPIQNFEMHFTVGNNFFVITLRLTHIFFHVIEAFPLKSYLKNCFSVQEQDKFGLRTAIDQRGVQTIIKDNKTTRDIKNFVSDGSTIGKWCNRCEQARNTRELYRGGRGRY